MKKFFEGILVCVLIFSLTGCSNGHNASTDSDNCDNSKVIYESTISPNEEYVEENEDKVFYRFSIRLKYTRKIPVLKLLQVQILHFAKI